MDFLIAAGAIVVVGGVLLIVFCLLLAWPLLREAFGVDVRED